MAGKQGPQGATVVEYLRKHPTMPKLALAKLIFKDHPDLFPGGVEACRKQILTYTTAKPGSGKRPNMHSDLAKRYGTARPSGKSGEDAWQALMPDSWSEPRTPFVLPTSMRKLLVLSDIHAPFHDIEALSLAIDYGIKNNVDGVLLNGDIADFYAVSDHEKDPRKVDWQGELEVVRSIFSMVRKAFPGVPIYFIVGNHSYRLERHMMKYSQILLGMPEFELPILFRLGELGIETIRNRDVIHAGRLTIAHGDIYRGAGGVNPARWLSLKSGEPMLIGHFHRTSTHLDRTVRGSVRGWWSTGCLCELTPEYLPANNWNLGFAVVHLDADGSFEVDNKMIIGGRVR